MLDRLLNLGDVQMAIKNHMITWMKLILLVSIMKLEKKYPESMIVAPKHK